MSDQVPAELDRAGLPLAMRRVGRAYAFVDANWREAIRRLDAVERLGPEAREPHGPSAGPVGGGDVSDPTSAAAAESLTAREAQLDLIEAVATWRMVSMRVEHLVRQALPPAEPEPRERPAVSDCCEPFCEDQASPGRAGRCEPCYRWRHRWAEDSGRAVTEAPPVPKRVIDARLAVRKRRGLRGVHITGPMSRFEIEEVVLAMDELHDDERTSA